MNSTQLSRYHRNIAYFARVRRDLLKKSIASAKSPPGPKQQGAPALKMIVEAAAAEIKRSLDVTGIAAIPTQVHHEVRATKHTINILLLGDEGLGKTKFINRCLKQQVFPNPKEHEKSTDMEVRVRRAELRENEFRATLNIVDVPRTGLSISRQDSYTTLAQYGMDQVKAYEQATSQLDRPKQQHIQDTRLSVALYFVNPLTTRRLSTLELGIISELTAITKVCIVIGKADCLLPEELARLKKKISNQLRDAEIDLYTDEIFAVSARDPAAVQKHISKEPFERKLFRDLMSDILRD